MDCRFLKEEMKAVPTQVLYDILTGHLNIDPAERPGKNTNAKLRGLLLSAINAEAKAFRSYENARSNFSDDTDERKAYERAMVKASELTKKAIAAINVLKGE